MRSLIHLFLFLLIGGVCVSACGANFTGTANPAVTKCGGQCVCQDTGLCCSLAQIDCAGVHCFDAVELTRHPGVACEFTVEGIFPNLSHKYSVDSGK